MTQTRARHRQELMSPAEFERMIRLTCQRLLACYPMYRRLHSMGLEPARASDGVKISGSGSELTEVESVVDSRRAQASRDYARRVAKWVGQIADNTDRTLQSLEENVGPGPGYRQPTTIGSDAIVTMDEFRSALDNQAGRLKAGME